MTSPKPAGLGDRVFAVACLADDVCFGFGLEDLA
jgi:hypothetical protein